VYFVKDRRHGKTLCIFTWIDPQRDGYTGPLEADVSLDYDLLKVHEWPDGAPVPDVCLGRKPGTKEFKVFQSQQDREHSKF